MTTLGTIEELHEAASARAGLDDFGDPGYREPMQVLMESYVRDAGLTEAGMVRTKAMLGTVLETRLRLQQAYARWPQAGQVAIRRPIFVTGLPRTGTTALHRLLCLDPASQGLEHWLTEAPQPRPPRNTWDDNPDRRRMVESLTQHDAEKPEMKGIHFMSADMVEECWRAERLSFRSIAFQNTAHLPTYSSWLAGQDLAPAYDAHRDMLRMIGLNDPDRHWVLKSPSHLFGLDALMDTYPDALIIQTHRDPRTIVASVSSLVHTASKGTSTTYDAKQVGRNSLELWSRGAREFAKARERHDPSQFIDVNYEDFVADAPGVVARIHEQFGLPLHDEVRAAVTASHQKSLASERRPVHTYDLAGFGLTEAEVDAQFAGYVDGHFTTATPVS
ncbi:sulfotransferase family protein [Nocardioides sp. Root151]|uniref:sulfotransferase family protein n=1 Tax=Nocardioides sp. Root151 TaxID=1736475 RepID=UPI000AD044D5|nr:sulfotransferase [Nocardioides sp. Root151]